METHRTCKICNQEKPYDPTAKRQSKAQGFVGNVCWTCHKQAQALRYQEAMGLTDPAYVARKAEVKALKAQVLEAQRAKTRRRLQAQYAALEQACQATATKRKSVD